MTNSIKCARCGGDIGRGVESIGFIHSYPDLAGGETTPGEVLMCRGCAEDWCTLNRKPLLDFING